MTHLEILLKAYDEIGINYQVTVDEYSSSIVQFVGYDGSLSRSFIEFDEDGSIASY